MQQGFHHKTSYINTSQQNDIVERKNQHLLGVTIVILFQSNLPNFC